MHKKLFIPGSVEVRPEVLDKMSKSLIGNRGKEALLLQKNISYFLVGAFGDRQYEIAIQNNVPADKFSIEQGRALTPDVVDKALATGKYDLVAVTHNET